jgi:hypothetical protein
MKVRVLLTVFVALSISAFAGPSHKDKLTATVVTLPTGSHQVVLNFTQGTVPAGDSCPSGSGSTAITGNTVYRGTTSGGETVLAPVSSTPFTSYTDTTVTAGATYFYEVTATNCVGESPKSNEVTAVIPNPQVPAAPTGLTATAQ